MSRAQPLGLRRVAAGVVDGGDQRLQHVEHLAPLDSGLSGTGFSRCHWADAGDGVLDAFAAACGVVSLAPDVDAVQELLGRGRFALGELDRPGITLPAAAPQRRQNAGVSSTRTVKISSRPSSIAKHRIQMPGSCMSK